MQMKSLCAALLSAGLLAACGGGGGGDASPAPGPDNSTRVSLAGVAAKGLMAHALVTAHAIKADGSVDDTPMGPAVETDANGKYTLTFTGTAGQPYVIRVRAKDDGSTTHRDEATGTDQPLPAGFALRALVVPATSGSVSTSATVTPFSEMAVSAAERASGGVTAANAAQARSTVGQLLGFDPTALEVKPTSDDGAGPDEQKLALMLTAVSQLAKDGALGCDGAATAGEKTLCVVERLADAAKTDSIKLGDAGDDVSGALNGAVAAVLADPELKGAVDDSVVATIRDNLACTDNCAAAPVSTAAPIAAARAMFDNLRTDWQQLFSRGGANSLATGAANQEALKFRQAFDAVQVPVEHAGRITGVLLKAVHLMDTFKAGSGINQQGWLRGGVETFGFNGTFATALGCSLFTDTAQTTLATSPADTIASIGCRVTVGSNAVFDPNTQQFTTTNYMVGITLVPRAGVANAFDYTSVSRERVCRSTNVLVTCSGAARIGNRVLSAASLVNNEDGSQTVTPFAGSFSVTRDANQVLTGFAVQGDWPAQFDDIATSGALVNPGGRTALDLTGTRTAGTLAPVGNVWTNALQGSIRLVNAAGADMNVFTFKPGTSLVAPAKADDADDVIDPVAGTVNLTLTAGDSQVDGSLALTEPKADLAGTVMPTQVSFTGALRNRGSSGSFADFVTGTFSAATDRSAYDPALPTSASNDYPVSGSFKITVTAPSRPKVELSGSALGSGLGGSNSGTLQYRTLAADGAPRMVVNLTGQQQADGSTALTLNETTANLSMAWTSSSFNGEIRSAGQLIGQLDRSTRMLTFVDHTFFSLDFGL